MAGITGDTCLLGSHPLYPSERRARDGDLLQGSPMFISVELSSPDPEATSVVTRPVLKRLQAVDDPTYADMRGRAFLEDAGGPFMDAFAQVVDREVERNASIDTEPVRTNPHSLHRPRHDVESFWWVAFWALIRASPLPRCEEEDTGSHAALCTVSDSMLDWECLGNDMARARYLVDPPVKALHPVLRRYGSLLKDMAMYIAMPWHLCDATVPPTHAHSAFLRMLLSEICAPQAGGGGSDILLDTTKPRCAVRTHWLEVYARDLSVEDALPGSPPDASESLSRRYTAGNVAVIPSKRKLKEYDYDALEPPRKRLRDELWALPEQDEQDEQDELEATTRNDDRQARP